MNTLNKTKKVYAIHDNKGNFFQYIKLSELKKIYIKENLISIKLK